MAGRAHYLLLAVVIMAAAQQLTYQPEAFSQPLPSSTHFIIISTPSEGFVPSQIHIKIGDNIVFVNEDNSGFYGYAIHRVLSIDSKTGQPNGYFESGPLYLGNRYTANFPHVGTYTYIDALNPEMIGQVIVTQSD